MVVFLFFGGLGVQDAGVSAEPLEPETHHNWETETAAHVLNQIEPMSVVEALEQVQVCTLRFGPRCVTPDVDSPTVKSRSWP